MECAIACGDFDHLQTIRTYIQMALSIGVDHYTKEMEEIVVLDTHGIEAGRYKSIVEASKQLGIHEENKVSKQLGIHEENISAVLNGRQHTAGGYMYMKTKDYELVKRE